MDAHQHRAPPFEAPPVRLDGVEIPAAEIAAEMQHHPAGTAQEAWRAAAEVLVLRRLLSQEAERQGIDAEPEGEETEEEARIRRLLDRELRLPEADEATCRRWYAANRARFRTPDAWHASHILVAAAPEDEEARRNAEAAAALLALELQREPRAFGTLAGVRSACPSREPGGDLGRVEAGTTVPEFEAALRALKPGETAASPVASRYGYHLIRLHRHEPGRDLPFEAVHERIAAWLREAAWRRATHQYMAMLASRVAVEGLVLSAGADGPLVQ